MTGTSFLRPEALWLFPLALLVLFLWALRRRKRYVAFTTVKWLKQLRSRPSVIRRAPAVLITAALAFIVLTLMEPVIPFIEGEVHGRGLDIVLVLDLSSSMQEQMGSSRQFMAPAVTQAAMGPARFVRRTRLDVTKLALADFVKRRRDDRIGLVVFSDHAYLVSPLTFDYASLLDYIQFVDDQILRGEGMTAIGDGIALSNYLLSRQSKAEQRNKVIVVFTDGENNFGRDPFEVLDESNAAGIRVHMIGVDIEEQVRTKPAVELLVATIRRLGGRYFDAATEQELRNANGIIDSVEKGSLTSRTIVRNVPAFEWFAIPAVVLLVVGLVLRGIPYFSEFT
jgi:Ca-activated chloride channel family protein